MVIRFDGLPLRQISDCDVFRAAPHPVNEHGRGEPAR